MHLGVLLIAILLWVPAPHAVAQAPGELCNRPDITAATKGTIIAETVSFGGVDRLVCTYEPSSLAEGTRHPLIVALHPGNGNASQMMRDRYGIISIAEAKGYVAVFPNGLPRQGCDALPCLENNWDAPENVDFVAELIGRQKASARVLDDRVHLAGFSAGSVLVYSIIATPGFPHAIDSVVTVSGAFGIINANRPEAGFVVKQIHEGAPVDALLVQGGQDATVPAAGGLDESGRRVHVSFRTKVDYWRLATGTETTPPEPMDVRALVPDAPADLAAFRYANGGSTVIEVLDPGLGHAWPEWNLMAVAAELFER